jgi:hypothetical protein
MGSMILREGMRRVALAPVDTHSAAKSSPYLDVRGCTRLRLEAIACSDAGSFDDVIAFDVDQATDSSGTGAKAATGQLADAILAAADGGAVAYTPASEDEGDAAANAFAFTAADDGKKLVLDIELANDDLDYANGFGYITLTATNAAGGSSGIISMELFAYPAPYQPEN